MKDIHKHIKYSIIGILFAFAILLVPSSQVDAANYTSVGGEVDITSSLTTGTSYHPGQPLLFSASITSPLGLAYDVDMAMAAINSTGVTIASSSVFSLQTLTGFIFVPPTLVSGATTTLGTYDAVFTTGVETAVTPANIYVKVTQLTSDSGYITLQTEGGYACPGGWDDPGHTQSWNTYPYLHTTYRAEFYSDVAATTPVDVTGLNFKLKQEAYSNGSIGYTAILSGTSYDFTGYSSDNGYTAQYGSSSCDQETSISGFGILDGTSVTPTPYNLIPEPPIAYFNAPEGVYQNTNFNISWNSQYATSCTGTNFSTFGSVNGNATESQSSATTYTVTCSNILGSDTKSKTVQDWGIFTPPPTCNAYPGNSLDCPLPSFCGADPMHAGYEICNP
jgi:hypothetical protein